MKPIKVLELSEVDRLKLEKGYHNGPTHSFRIRCKSILLKSEGKSAPQIAEMLEVTVPTVYTWVKRYEENIRIIMLSVRIHHECHGADMGRNLGNSSTGCREEQSVIQQYAPLHQTSGEGIIGRRGDTTETEQHLQF